MDFYMKLPRNAKEFALFLILVSILSVNIIAPLISCFELGFSLRVWQGVMKTLPVYMVERCGSGARYLQARHVVDLEADRTGRQLSCAYHHQYPVQRFPDVYSVDRNRRLG